MAQMYTTTMRLMLLVMAIAAVSSAAFAEDEAPAQGRGRFLASFDEQAPISARRHLNAFSINGCGPGDKDHCQERHGRVWKKPLCCRDRLGNSACYDAGILLDKCGSCTNRCTFGEKCCNGTCVNPKSDSNNCGLCGKVCRRGVPCTNFMCGYNGKF